MRAVSFVSFWATLGLAAASLLADPTPQQKASLTRGTNAGWLNSNSAKDFNTVQMKEDIKLLNQTGIRHVRLYAKLSNMTADQAPDTLSPTFLANVDTCLKQLKEEGIAAIVAPFHGMKPGTPALGSPEAANLVKLCSTLAKHLTDTDPNFVFLEVYDEPDYEKPEDWNELQNQCLAAMREAAPKHLLIASANLRSAAKQSTDSLRALTLYPPSPDANVVYSFHYVRPVVFTFQGTSFKSLKNTLKQVPYPSTPENTATLAAAEENATLKNLLTTYGQERWGRAKIRQELGAAAAWAKKNNKILTCGSFGVFRNAVNPEDRENYLRDVREVLEELEIPWTAKSESCGILDRKRDHSVLDEVAVRALGLSVK